MKEFSHVFTGDNDAGRCKSCRSDNIKRIIKRQSKAKGIYY
jgi:hypothetical protein